MIIAGLTGQSGAGKTTVSRVFAQNGFYVIDCDKAARKAVLPESECVTVLSKEFPDFFDERVLDRKKAAAVLFSDKASLEKYNSLIFPFIRELIGQEIDTASESGYEYVLLDAPTLFEAGADSMCDVIIACVADEDIRLKRITARDNITEEQAKKRFSSQKSEDFFRQRCDYVIENNTTEEYAVRAVKKILEQIMPEG